MEQITINVQRNSIPLITADLNKICLIDPTRVITYQEHTSDDLLAAVQTICGNTTDNLYKNAQAIIGQVDSDGNPIYPGKIALFGVVYNESTATSGALQTDLEIISNKDFYCLVFNHKFSTHGALEEVANYVNAHKKFAFVEADFSVKNSMTVISKRLAFIPNTIDIPGLKSVALSGRYVGYGFANTMVNARILNGVQVDNYTTTDLNAYLAANYILYTNVDGIVSTYGSMCADGLHHVDEVMALDKIEIEMRTNLRRLQVYSEKIPGDSRGEMSIIHEVSQVMQNNSDLIAEKDNGATDYSIVTGNYNRSTRKYENIIVNMVLAGAIESVSVKILY